MDLDDPRTTSLQRSIIRDKPFLRAIYDEWYASIAAALPPIGQMPEPVIELGSGAGYMRRFVPNLITSDIFNCDNLDIVTDGCRLPFADASLRGLAMVDVLHHIPGVERFFTQAARCIRPGGVITMIEPWATTWSTWVYQNLHHEPFRPDAKDWSIPASGPLSGANGALPWILFERDRDQFKAKFPALRIESIQPIMPLRYLLSGGVSMRSLQPGVATSLWRGIERLLLSVAPRKTAMFAKIVIRRV